MVAYTQTAIDMAGLKNSGCLDKLSLQNTTKAWQRGHPLPSNSIDKDDSENGRPSSIDNFTPVPKRRRRLSGAKLFLSEDFATAMTDSSLERFSASVPASARDHVEVQFCKYEGEHNR
jgi:hypothetical protein